MGAVILGKIHLRWCDECNLPIIEQGACSACSSKTRPVRLTPPGDARPAFEGDLKRIRALIDTQFGEGTGNLVLPLGRIVLLNKSPDLDRMDEVIVDGEVTGAVRFSMVKGEKFLLKPKSALAIAPHVARGWVKIDPVAADAIREKSASTLAVGVDDCDPAITPGDEVLVLDASGCAVSVGVSKMTASEMKSHRRGTAVKTRWTVPGTKDGEMRKGADWKHVVEANREVIRSRTATAIDFIKKTAGESGLPVAVSYSGGKDSLATLLLVMDSGIRPTMLFVDTGLEFEETKKNVTQIASEYGLDLVIESAGDSFWKNVGRFGPPAKDFRWCCKTCKLGPATQLIRKNFPDGVLSFIGQRAYESQQRAQKKSVWRNPWTPNQLAASPIQKWTAMHVWLYLMSKGANVNPLYEKGLERIGCFMCPATDLAELRRVREMSPQYSRWQEVLEAHAKTAGRSKIWLDYDLWRWKRVPKSVFDELGIQAEDAITDSANEKQGRLEFKSTKGYSPCVEGLSMEGVFSTSLPMEKVINLLNIIGEVTASPDGNIAEVRSITVFREGPVMIKAIDERELEKKSSDLRDVVFRAVECAGCGICVARCPTGALHVDDTISIDVKTCSHCGSCLGPCPAVRFREDDLDI